MALFDSLIGELEQRFGLGESARAFVADTIRYIVATDHGGLRGFIDLFKEAGLGHIAASWVTKVRESLPLTGAQLEGVLGSGLIDRLASRFSLPDSTARDALAYAVPKLVNLLTPAGYIQDSMEGEVASFLERSAAGVTPAAAAVGPIVAAVSPAAAAVSPAAVVKPAAATASPAVAAVSPAAAVVSPAAVVKPAAAAVSPAAMVKPAAAAVSPTAVVKPATAAVSPAAAATRPAVVAPVAAATPAVPAPPPPSTQARESRGMPVWGWLAALAWAGLLGYWAWHGPEQAQDALAVAAVQPQALPVPRLALSNDDGKVQYAGVVADEKSRATILDGLSSVFGAANCSGELELDPRVGPASWLADLGALLPRFRLPGADLLLEGNDIKVGGWLSDTERSKLLDAIKLQFGSGFSFGFLGDKTGEAVKTGADRTRAALAALRAGYGGADLVKALNLWVINFSTDSAEVPLDSLPLVTAAAQAILGAPPTVVIEIAGHTDNSGDPARNRALSEARAVSVREALVVVGVPAGRLKARGYGSDIPVASNETPAGRFRNRRIEFKTQQ
ncbi:OmpA family protein [Candidatus Thiodictyon syntrophicum]|jgi:uncharacterized protein YidB (DUF937 family)|uniref:OmpA-like domain-containing protein n=1 Tax=Candidatus Thiodictyon syntrophicum TaxID=1166950 RepID=A0A2K8UEA5_9GAMM|nr:OmpA family protein [Candidatus Thiodictyon syntrophicum]AUB83817.1 hypothetical protein THSYN_24610 [Candidatus Thiodictyon syntrophicum]